MNTVAINIIRTIVPVLVGAVGSFLATQEIKLDTEALAGLSAFLTAFLTGVYYVVARLLEEHLDSRFGYLLGHKKAK